MLIHAMISWPNIVSEQLWPFALQLAVNLHNDTHGPSGLSPLEIFSGVKSLSNKLCDFHPFGCPIFISDPSLQQGHKIPHWKPRCSVGVYLGFSPNHASSVPLVLSTTTGLMSPQFHIVYDDLFMTANCLQTNTLPDTWSTLLTTSTCKYVDGDFTSTNFVDPVWFHNDITTLSPPSKDSSSPREGPSSILSTSQREGSLTTTKPGRNASHGYDTQLHKKILANTATASDLSSPFDDDLYSAFISVQDSYPIHLSSDLYFLKHFSCAAHTNPDVLHYGIMLKDSD